MTKDWNQLTWNSVKYEMLFLAALPVQETQDYKQVQTKELHMVMD